MMPILSEAPVESEASIAYKTAFRCFSEKVRALQRLRAKPNLTRAELKAAVLSVEKARVAYSRARNAVAQQLLSSTRKAALPAGGDTPQAYTAELAELLWEYAGKPEG